MTTQSYPTMGQIPEQWLRAMVRATTQGVRCHKLTTGDYLVRSTSNSDSFHIVHVAPNGKIVACDCPATVPCKHKGAVSKRLLTVRFGEYQVRKMLEAALPRKEEAA